MTDYTNLTDAERFDLLDQLAIQLFGTARWRTMFAKRYGIDRTTVQRWKDAGAPVWALVAVQDALAARRLEELQSLIAQA